MTLARMTGGHNARKPIAEAWERGRQGVEAYLHWSHSLRKLRKRPASCLRGRSVSSRSSGKRTTRQEEVSVMSCVSAAS